MVFLKSTPAWSAPKAMGFLASNTNDIFYFLRV
jgi:hypothetical protein